MGRSQCAILLNSKAGAFTRSTTVQQLLEVCREAGLDAEVVDAQERGQMAAEVRRLVARKAPLIAVAGGDGTVSIAVQEIAGSETVLGIIPQGTFNNFATALRLPMNLPSAVRTLAEGQPMKVDLGRVETRYFTESAGVGIFADGLALYGSGTNKSFFRAVSAMFRVLFSLRARRITLNVDGAATVERAVMCTAANSYRMSAGLAIAPSAKLTDGMLDVVVIGDLTRGELIRTYRAVRAQTHLSMPKVTAHEARSVKIQAPRRMNVHADDRVVAATPATITAEPAAIRVMVDRL